MDDVYENEDYEEYFNDPKSLVSALPHDEHAEYQRIQEELYQEAFEAEFNRVANFHSNLLLNCNLSTNDGSSKKKEYVVRSSNETPEKKRKRGDKAPRSSKKHKKDKKSDESKKCSEILLGMNGSSTKKHKKLKTPAKNQSLKELVEDAGLTMNDLKSFLEDNQSSHTNNSLSETSSDYIVISETSESKSESGVGSESDDEDLDLNIVSHSMSKDDITLTRILSSLPDDSSWNISTSDIIGQSSSSIPRFHNLMKKVRCTNCNERGHYTSLCPRPRKLFKCILCGETGHQYRSCPDQLCFKCDLPGHSVRDCTERVASYHDQCKRCFVRGHYEERCPDTWRQYHLTISEGKILRERDIQKEGSEQRGKIRSCYNCGEMGHLGHTCQEPRMDKFQTVCTPYIFKYDKECEQSRKYNKKEKTNRINESDKKYPKQRDKHNHEKRLQKNDLEKEHRNSRAMMIKDNQLEKSTDTSYESFNSQRYRKGSFKNDSSHRGEDWGDNTDIIIYANNDSKNQQTSQHKSSKAVPLMDLTLPAYPNVICSSTPLVRNSSTQRKFPKFIESDSFPRDSPLQSMTKKKNFNFISPIAPDSSNFDMSPKRVIDSYMGEAELQNSYYGGKEMKKARRKQAIKDKKLLLKAQLQESKDKNMKSAKQWWSVPKSQKHEFFQEMSGTGARQKSVNVTQHSIKAKRIRRKSEFSQKTCDSNDQALTNMRRKSGDRKNSENIVSNITHRGFRLGTFQ